MKKWVARGKQWPDTGPVARQAKGGRGHNRKMHARLQSRMQDYTTMMSAKNTHGGVQQRKETGGYHKPGANR